MLNDYLYLLISASVYKLNYYIFLVFIHSFIFSLFTCLFVIFLDNCKALCMKVLRRLERRKSVIMSNNISVY